MTKTCIQIYKGHGKGKTTAAVGCAVRALGAGLHVGWCCFLKTDASCELTVLKKQDACEIFPCPAHMPFAFQMTEDERAYLREFYRKQMEHLLTALPSLDVLVLDEVLDALSEGLLEEETLLNLLHAARQQTEILMTGRSAPPVISDLADYITVMQAERHPYNVGLSARRGIEF